MTLHNAYAVKYGSTVLSGLTNLNTQLNPQVQNETGIGSPFPQFQAITEQKPSLQFQATMVAAALAVTGTTGAIIDGTNNLDAFYASLGNDGLPVAGSVHRSYTAIRGLLIPRRLNVGHRQRATLDMEALTFSSDGAAHPLVIADNVALPTLVVANVEHTLGALSLGPSGGAVVFDCAQSLAIDFGNGAQTRGCGSDIFDKHLEQPGIKSIVTLTGLSATAFGAAGVPPVGLKVEHAGTALYLRKRDEGVGFVSDVTAEHIKITVDGVAVVTQHTGQGTAAAEVTLQIYCGWDGTNAPIVIDTASAIT